MKIHAIVLAIAGAASLYGQPAGSLRVLSSNGIRAVVEEVLSQAQQAAGEPIAIEYATSSSIRQRVEGGEAFDVVLVTAEAIDALAAKGKIVEATRTELGRSGIGIGVRAGAAKPDIRTAAALKAALIKAKSITYAQDGASRTYIERMMESLGIAAEMRAKTVLEQGSTRATAAVAAGRVELVLTLASEIIPVKGIALAGLLPSEFQNNVSIQGAVGSQARNGPAGEALIRFLSSAAVDPVLRANGMVRR